MTCIVGLEHGGKVWMGADSAGTNSHMNQIIRSDKKIFVRNDMLFGFCGSFRMGQLLQHKLEIPPNKSKNDVTYLVNDLMQSVKVCMTEANVKLENVYFLLGYHGKLYTIQGDLQVGQPEHGFDAAGSGGDIATGAMHVSSHIKNPKQRIINALQASALGNAAVRPPFHVLCI